MTDLIQERFDHLRREEVGEWGEIRKRVERRGRRRRIAVIGALALAAALVAPTALALRGAVVDFFTAEPGSDRVVLSFAQMDVGAPPGMAPNVIQEQTRKVFERRLNNGRVIGLWVAPTREGGFCTHLDLGGGGCLPRVVEEHERVAFAPGVSIRGPIERDGTIRGGPVLISGSVSLGDADAVELRYEDGGFDRQALTWVSEPIDAAFFVFDVEPSRWNGDRQPNAVAALDGDGDELRVEQLHFSPGPFPDPETGAPAAALQHQARELLTLKTHTGAEAALWVAPTKDGRRCAWLRDTKTSISFGGGCPPKDSATHPLAVVTSQGSGVVLIWGGPVREDVSSIEARYEDGERAQIPVVEGLVLYEIPPRHFPRGHRLELMIARDADGRELVRQKRNTSTPGSYPCKKPVPLGYGVEACP